MSKHNIMMHGLLSAVLVCSVISVAGAAEVTLPYKFTAGTPAVADFAEFRVMGGGAVSQ